MKRTMVEFDAAYDRLAGTGVCDGRGGMEYTRVLDEWVAAGRPADIEEWIKWRATASADDDYYTSRK